MAMTAMPNLKLQSGSPWGMLQALILLSEITSKRIKLRLVSVVGYKNKNSVKLHVPGDNSASSPVDE